MTCEPARKQLEEARQAHLDVEKRLLEGISPYIGGATVPYADEGEKIQRLRGLNGEYVAAANRFHKAVDTFLAFTHLADS